ncbi:accessory gene regulator B family protein [Wukongibacter baidiensis]|uniref:accessory gene regulator ArgB-like protein n=1 Tax=Wukongibacter baidiensis TaxID=1723361 RepID=UPI003D7F2EA5
MRRLADNISNYISREMHYNEEKTEVLSYGLQIFLGTSISIISELVCAYFFNIFQSTLIVSISYTIFRRLVGGSHYETQSRCYFMGLIMILSLGKLGEVTSLTSMGTLISTILIYFLALTATILWVPAGTEKKMIKNIDTRRKIKIKVIVILTIWFIICSHLNMLGISKYVISSALGVFLAFFFVTPLGYRFTNLKLF